LRTCKLWWNTSFEGSLVVDGVVVRTGSAKVHLTVVEEVLTRLGSCNLKMERSRYLFGATLENVRAFCTGEPIAGRPRLKPHDSMVWDFESVCIILAVVVVSIIVTSVYEDGFLASWLEVGSLGIRRLIL